MKLRAVGLTVLMSVSKIFLDSGKCVLFIFLAIQLGIGYNVTDHGHTEQESLSLHLLAVVSTSSQRKVQNANAGDVASVPKWERGHEILYGAHAAIEEINNSLILRQSGHHLDIMPIITTECDVDSVLVDYVQNLVTTKNIIGNIGKSFTSLIGGKHRQIYTIQISTSTDYPPESQMTGPHHVLPPLTTYAKALVSLLAQLGWSRIAVLKTGAHYDTYYSRLAEAFVQLIGSNKIIYKNEISDDLH